MKTASKLIGRWLRAVVGCMLASCTLLAQESPKAPDKSAETDDIRASMEVLRSDFNTAKIRTFNQVMKLNGQEAEKFWPIYRRYEKELSAVGDRKLALIREFAQLQASSKLDNAAAKGLAERWLQNVQDRFDLWKKYHKEISEAVSPIRGAQFLQIENQMALFVDLNIAAAMPVVGLQAPTKQKDGQ
jgi:hypothetical protein